MEHEQPQYQTEFTAVAYASHVEWEVVMDGGVPKLLGVPSEVTEHLAEAYMKIARQIDKEEKRIGFWRQNVNYTGNGSVSFPVITTCKEYDKVAKGTFLLRLAEIEHLALVNRYRGWSQHRWTGEANGSTEFFFRDWRWPVGYSTYLKAGVLPSREFYAFITGKDIPTLPSYSKEKSQ